MGQLDWAMWANEHAVASSVVTIMCGILTTAGQFRHWEIGVYALIAGVLTFTLEYPRGKRQKGSSYERRYQRPLTALVRQGRFLTRNYFVRFVLYLILAVPCCFVMSTLMAAMSYMVTACIYFLAAVKGEEWQPCEPPRGESGGPEVIQEPKHPPPRRPPVEAGDGEGNRL